MLEIFRPNITEEAIENVVKVLRSGWIGLGPQTEKFEQAFAEYVGAPYCVALNSCTSALHLALRILRLQDGDEIVTTPITFVSTNMVLLYERLSPVFADVEYGTLNMDVDDVASKITKRTKAIIVMHFGGQPVDMDEFRNLARAYNLPIIQDAAHAVGAEYKGIKIGSVHGDDICCWSFHAVKNLPMGDGGAVTTFNKEIYERLKRLRWLAIDKDTFARTVAGKSYAWKYNVDEVGYKYHMNDISATIGLAQLKVLDEHNAIRKRIADRYMHELQGVELPEFKSDRVSSNHLFEVKVKDRDAFMDRMKGCGVACGAHYFPNDAYSIFPKAKLPVVDSVSEHLVTLPMHTLMSDDDVSLVIDSVRRSI